MHEMSLAEEVLHIIEQTSKQQPFIRVKTIWLEIGQLSCVEAESLRFCFESISQYSIAHHAHLEIIETPGYGWCHTCQTKVIQTTLHDACPYCGSYGLEVMSGDMLRIKELEVE